MGCLLPDALTCLKFTTTTGEDGSGAWCTKGGVSARRHFLARGLRLELSLIERLRDDPGDSRVHAPLLGQHRRIGRWLGICQQTPSSSSANALKGSSSRRASFAFSRSRVGLCASRSSSSSSPSRSRDQRTGRQIQRRGQEAEVAQDFSKAISLNVGSVMDADHGACGPTA